MLSAGVVREWNDDHGWGVIDSADAPGGCWAHFSMIVSPGYRTLDTCSHVVFTYETAAQDGFSCRAVQVWSPGVSPEALQQPAQDELSAAYRSSLTIQWQDGNVTSGLSNCEQDS